MLPRFAGFLCLAGLTACSRPALPDTVVHAASAEELVAFRADLGDRFAPGDLKSFDDALTELKLGAIDRGIATAAAREEQVRAAIAGRPVREVVVLGRQARRTRLQGEIAQMQQFLDNDLRNQERTAATGTPQSVLTHLQNEREILARLQRDLVAVEQQLAAAAP